MKFANHRTKNILGKGENASDNHFLHQHLGLGGSVMSMSDS